MSRIKRIIFYIFIAYLLIVTIFTFTNIANQFAYSLGLRKGGYYLVYEVQSGLIPLYPPGSEKEYRGKERKIYSNPKNNDFEFIEYTSGEIKLRLALRQYDKIVFTPSIYNFIIFVLIAGLVLSIIFIKENKFKENHKD
ncbi:MAG: hypothetical protein ACOCRX_12155 [Candidatus Woesearchaeota archaeon]